MATCPECGANSRDGGFVAEVRLVPKPLGTFSLSGQAMKVSATSRVRLTCACGWTVEGRLDGDHLVVDHEGGAPTGQH